jgi:predicted nucleic acid-binding protein
VTIYLLDSNVVSDLIVRLPAVREHVAAHLAIGDTLALCHPIYYELLRGLFWRNATGKLAALNNQILPLLTWIALEDATRRGRQLADPDLLLTALAYRTGAILVSNDEDFDVLPVVREDWRAP